MDDTSTQSMSLLGKWLKSNSRVGFPLPCCKNVSVLRLEEQCAGLWDGVLHHKVMQGSVIRFDF